MKEFSLQEYVIVRNTQDVNYLGKYWLGKYQHKTVNDFHVWTVTGKESYFAREEDIVSLKNLKPGNVVKLNSKHFKIEQINYKTGKLRLNSLVNKSGVVIGIESIDISSLDFLFNEHDSKECVDEFLLDLLILIKSYKNEFTGEVVLPKDISAELIQLITEKMKK